MFGKTHLRLREAHLLFGRGSPAPCSAYTGVEPVLDLVFRVCTEVGDKLLQRQQSQQRHQSEGIIHAARRRACGSRKHLGPRFLYPLGYVLCDLPFLFWIEPSYLVVAFPVCELFFCVSANIAEKFRLELIPRDLLLQ